MAQYIDKDALVAKIKRRFDECSSSILKNYDACKEAKALELGKILTIIDTLEVKNSTHRTPADIESAMQEVEAKSEAYTNAHRGERDDDVLSQMRGEPVSEDLGKEIDLVEDKYRGFESLSRADVIDVAKHFFELGLKAQKGE